MKRKIFLVLLSLVISGFLGIFFFSSEVSAQSLGEKPSWTGIVPCGRNNNVQGNEGAQCTLCDLVVGIHRLFIYGLYIIVSIALLAFFIAAVMYTVSTGDQGMMDSAKKFMMNSMIGLVFVAGAWLLVNVALWTLGAKPNNLSLNMPNWYSFQINCGMNADSSGCCYISDGNCSTGKEADCSGTFYAGSCTAGAAAQLCASDDKIMGCCTLTTNTDGSEKIGPENCKSNVSQMECNSISGGNGILWEGTGDCNSLLGADFDKYCKKRSYDCESGACVQKEGGSYDTNSCDGDCTP